MHRQFLAAEADCLSQSEFPFDRFQLQTVFRLRTNCLHLKTVLLLKAPLFPNPDRLRGTRRRAAQVG